MYKGRGAYAYIVLKVALYTVGFFEFLYYSRRENSSAIIILFSILAANSFIRQIFIYRKEKLLSIGLASIVLDYLLCICLASLRPVSFSILMFTPAIAESVIVYSLTFGGSLSAAALIALIILDILGTKQINNYYYFFRGIFVSYGLGFFLIFVISYLARLQFQERERMLKANRELEQAYELLLNHSSKLQELSVEKERNRVAREIHDSLAHTLTALVVQLEAGRKLIDVDALSAKAEIEKAQALTRTGLSELKGTIKALRPQMLDNMTLTDAVNNLILDMKERVNVTIRFDDNQSCGHRLYPAAEVALFRVIQESVTNAIRHGNASLVDISMTEKDGLLTIEIKDNGKGCTHIKEGYGLKGIIERIKGLDGIVQFASTEGEGFRTIIAIPCKGGGSNEY